MTGTRRLVVSALLAVFAVRAAQPVAEVLEAKIISPADNLAYHGWPTLARLTNGQLAVVVSGGREAHVCPFGRVDILFSSGRGETWSWPRTILDTDLDDRDAGILQTTNGTLLVTTFTSLAYEPLLENKRYIATWSPEKIARWKAQRDKLAPAQRKAALGEWLIRSTDGGQTWSKPIPTIVNSPHGPIQLRDGRLLYLGKQLWTREKRVGAAESTDDGLTWKWIGEIPARPGDTVALYHELHAVETTGGKLIAHIRNQNKVDSLETLQTESTDGGRTWSEPHPIGVWGLPSHLLRLRNGNLLMTYGHRRDPFGNQARLSTDDGVSWSEPMTISDDGAGIDLGYPSTVELPDGSLLTVWYEQLLHNPRAVLRQARWRITTAAD